MIIPQASERCRHDHKSAPDRWITVAGSTYLTKADVSAVNGTAAIDAVSLVDDRPVATRGVACPLQHLELAAVAAE
ncbi:hypothetical protein [Bradyrhizobium sp. SZCCHNRI20481]|uniref:hypothetical protein n=1 Tax=Bradyrhizobium sp. SZCCHNRI20481 TaxID=3057286 RepID=UPI002916F9A8|nr:hypothetical protein [Bradyrhizobium sp. SZCCHNRI20481]